MSKQESALISCDCSLYLYPVITVLKIQRQVFIRRHTCKSARRFEVQSIIMHTHMPAEYYFLILLTFIVTLCFEVFLNFDF